MTNELESLRDGIDELDRRICELLRERFSAVKRIGEYKNNNGLPVYDGSRESAVYERIASFFNDEREKGGIKNIYAAIVAECKKLQN